jgi:O-antigen/teichoic acid export membrane protein
VPLLDLIWQAALGELERIRSSSLLHNGAWILLGRGLSILCQGAYFILLARLLGSTEYGIYVGVVATVSVVSIYSSLGSHFVFLRYVSQDPGSFALYWGNVLVTTLALGSFFIVLLTWAGPYVAHSYNWMMLLCVAIADCLCAQLTAAAGHVFLAFERVRFTAALSLLVNLLRTLMAGVMLWSMHQATARQWIVAALAVSAIAAVTALVLVTKVYGGPAFSLALLRSRVGEGCIFAFSYSTSSIYDNADKALMGHYGMNAANGIYTVAYRVIDVACVPFGSIQVAASPRFFRKGIEGVHSTTAYALRIIKRTAPVALLSIVVMLVAGPIIPRLVGASFSESVSVLRWLCLLPLFRSLHWGAGDALTGAGHLKLRLGNHVAAAGFNVGANLYLIPHYGWLGAAWASLATDGLLAVLNWAALLVVLPER